MVDNLFTVFSNLDPPPIKRNNIDIDSYSTKELFIDPDVYENIKDDEKEETLVTEPEAPQFRVSVLKDNDLKVLKGSKAFEEAFKEALKINPNISKYKNFLVKTAKRESGFNSYIQNKTGAPYYGYFQMGKNEIAMTTKMSVTLFRNDPVAQILGACKLYDMNLKTIKKLGVYNIGKEKGYSDDALIAGAWAGGPGGVKKYLLGLGDPSDSHWYKKAGMKGGTSVGKIMNNWKANENN